MNDFESTGYVMKNAAASRKGGQIFNRLGWAFVIFLASQLVLPIAVITLVSALAPNLLDSPFFGMPLAYICMYLIGFPLMLLLLRNIPDNTAVHTNSEGQKLSVGLLLALYPVSFAVLSIFSSLTTLFEQLIGKSATVTTADVVASNGSAWIPFVFGVIVAPIMEEIVFRRLIYKKVSGYGASVYILWSAIAFGLFHLNFGQSIYAAALGTVFAVIMYKTGSVIYSAILHVLVNFTAGIGVGGIIMRTGNETALTAYSYFIIALIILGTVIGIVLLIRKGAALKNKMGEGALVNKKVVFLNAGTMTYCVICVGFIIYLFLI